ncbi:MAG: DUF4115 domain-containing protein [Cocleimonas sp.]|nr:DUF4115 domain-containing protein [Cocleimonas sp.]
MSETETEIEQTTKKKENSISLGSLLKSYREKNGHDIYEVAEALCLSPEIVNALEKEDFASLPEPPYIRGYLRSYAKFADTDPQEIIERYEAQRGADPQDLEYHFKPTTDNLTKPVISASMIRLGLITLLLISLAALSMIPAVNSWISETWSGFSKQTADKNNAGAIGEPIAATNQFELPAPLPTDTPTKQPVNIAENTRTNTPDNSKQINDPANKSSDGNTGKNTENKTNPAEEKAEEATEKEPNSILTSKEGTKLRFVFKKEVWMRVKDKHKKTVFESLSPAGEEKEIRLKKPMTFRIGNAQGVEIYVEGKRLDISAFTQGSVANFAIE